MGSMACILGNILRSSSGTSSKRNEDVDDNPSMRSMSEELVYDIRKSEGDPGCVELFFGGSLWRRFHEGGIYIRNENLAIKDYFKYNRNDSIVSMSRCYVKQEGTGVYITSDTWRPVAGIPYPERLITSVMNDRGVIDHEQAFCMRFPNGSTQIILCKDSSKGCFGVECIDWQDDAPNIGEWYLCEVSTPMYLWFEIKPIELAMDDGSMIIKGYMRWDPKLSKWCDNTK